MRAYIWRRILYMIPMVFGIILVTFFLFNVAGGDPALMKLGKNATAQSLEQYDAQRGYDKPLFAGRWGRTRAWTEMEPDRHAGSWRLVKGVAWTNTGGGRVVLPGGQSYGVPMAFRPRPGTYRWIMEYRLVPADDGTLPSVEWVSGQARMLLPQATGWRSQAMVWQVVGDETGMISRLSVPAGTLEIRAMTLKRRNAHWLDSQLVFYLGQLARGDFGVSHDTNERISRMMLRGIGPSLMLTVPIFFVGLVVSISLALLCAFFRNTWLDRFFVLVSVVLMSVNYLVWIIFGQYFLGYRLRWFPVWGFESWRYLLLPVLIGVISGLGGSLRFYRTVMLDEMYRDYVRTAFAKGAGRGRVLFVHVLRNAMIPVMTNVVMSIPFLYTGSLLLERLFGIPGLGNMAYEGIMNSDVDVIRAVVFVGAVIYVFANLLTDISYAWVDPRVRLK